jgi:hypothetical protein
MVFATCNVPYSSTKRFTNERNYYILNLNHIWYSLYKCHIEADVLYYIRHSETPPIFLLCSVLLCAG